MLQSGRSPLLTDCWRRSSVFNLIAFLFSDFITIILSQSNNKRYKKQFAFLDQHPLVRCLQNRKKTFTPSMLTLLLRPTSSNAMSSMRRAPPWSRTSTPRSACPATSRTPRTRISTGRTSSSSKRLLSSSRCSSSCSTKPWMAPKLYATMKSTIPGQIRDQSVSTELSLLSTTSFQNGKKAILDMMDAC